MALAISSVGFTISYSSILPFKYIGSTFKLVSLLNICRKSNRRKREMSIMTHGQPKKFHQVQLTGLSRVTKTAIEAEEDESQQKGDTAGQQMHGQSHPGQNPQPTACWTRRSHLQEPLYCESLYGLLRWWDLQWFVEYESVFPLFYQSCGVYFSLSLFFLSLFYFPFVCKWERVDWSCKRG